MRIWPILLAGPMRRSITRSAKAATACRPSVRPATWRAPLEWLRTRRDSARQQRQPTRPGEPQHRKEQRDQRERHAGPRIFREGDVDAERLGALDGNEARKRTKQGQIGGERGEDREGIERSLWGSGPYLQQQNGGGGVAYRIARHEYEGRQKQQVRRQQVMVLQPGNEGPGNAGIGERAGDSEKRDEKEEQRPVEGRDHHPVREAPIGQQRRGDQQSADFPRQRRREQQKQQRHAGKAFPSLDPVMRVAWHLEYTPDGRPR